LVAPLDVEQAPKNCATVESRPHEVCWHNPPVGQTSAAPSDVPPPATVQTFLVHAGAVHVAETVQLPVAPEI
jgi:hypothetical protein